MSGFNLESIDLNAVIELYKDKVGAILFIDAAANKIKPLIKRGIFEDFIKDDFTYTDLIEKLWYHFNNSSQTIVEDYQVFIPTSGKFRDKYSKRVNLMIDNIVHVTQYMVYPLGDDKYLFFLDELDRSMFHDEEINNQINANVYLFSMYIDIARDTTSSISVTEISDEVVNQQLKYSEWRMMIVNMIAKEYQAQFLEETDPETLRKKYVPGQTCSFDCMMMNLEGVYIWVKLIFSRAETNNDDDYRFVFMVKNIHEDSVELRKTLKKYEHLASFDSLTDVYNHGRIETELNNAVVERGKNDTHTSVMMLDIDFFKRVNDEYGHATGDDTLKRFVSMINDNIKDKNAVLGRWGGEEFAVVCYDTPIDKAVELAEVLRKSIEEAEFEKAGHITCSIGVTEIAKDDEFAKVFERMDGALYKAKSEGRNRVVSA